MSRIRRRSLPLAALLLAGFASSAQAATWTEIPSSTTEDITAIEYQGADRFWYTTGAGKIFRRVGGVFQQEASVPATVFKDIEFQDGGLVGFAVGTNGVVMRSADGGDTWVAVAIIGGRQTAENDCGGADQAIGDADSIRFAGNARAWITAGGTQIYRTVAGATAANVGSAGAGWQYVNDGGATCRITHDIDDTFPVPGSDAIYFVSKYFGEVWFSSNALSSDATIKPADAGNGFRGTRRLAGDPGNPNRQWAVSSDGSGGSYYERTIDGWSTSAGWSIANPDRGDLTVAEGIDFNGGTVLAIGSGGMIVESIDGTNFFHDPAGGAVATQDWRSVSLASAAAAAIGGTAGKLIVSVNANVTPDIVAPTGTIVGPSSVNVGAATAFSGQVADNLGGSGIDPASFAWTVAGLPGQAGPTATFAFPSAGFYTIRLTFRDNAGNPAELFKSVTAQTAVAPNPPVPPAFGFASKSNPPVVGGAARRVGRFVQIKVSGSFRRPSGVSAALACKGTVALTVSKTSGRKPTLTKGTATVSSTCKYKRTLRVRRTRVGRSKRLKLKVAFKGNSVIRASSVTYTIPVR